MPVVKKRFVFNIDFKKEFLKGKTCKVVASNMNVTSATFSRFLHNELPVYENTAREMMRAVGYSEKDILNYFDKYFTLIN